jgi:hypothetical protein
LGLNAHSQKTTRRTPTASANGTALQVNPVTNSSGAGLSLNLIALLFLAHLFIPKSRVHTRKFFQLSYYNPKTGQYGIGHDDSLLVTFSVIVFTGLRAAVMEYVLAPLARSQGIQKKKLQNRFCEQAWLLTYYIFFWTLGVVSNRWKRLRGYIG